MNKSNQYVRIGSYSDQNVYKSTLRTWEECSVFCNLTFCAVSYEEKTLLEGWIWCCFVPVVCEKRNNQIKSKSNHFYCHITTAQVPWWVKFLWACSRQCKKKQQQQFTYGQTVQKNNNNNLHMDRQCKKTTNNLHMDSTYLQTVQKTMCKIHVHIVYYKDILNYQRHIIHRMGTSTLCLYIM